MHISGIFWGYFCHIFCISLVDLSQAQGWCSSLVVKVGSQDWLPRSVFKIVKITVSGRFFGLFFENLECYLKSCFLSHVYVNMSDRSSIFTQETKMRKSTVHSIHSQYISTLSDSCKRYPAVYPYVQFQDHIYAGVDL